MCLELYRLKWEMAPNLLRLLPWCLYLGAEPVTPIKIYGVLSLLRGMLRHQRDCLNIDFFVSCVTKSAELSKTVVIFESHNAGCDI